MQLLLLQRSAIVALTVTLTLTLTLTLTTTCAGKTVVPPHHECSACELIAHTLASSLFDELPATSIEVGSALNDPTSYAKVAYASSELRITEAIEALCSAVYKGTIHLDHAYSSSRLVNASLPTPTLTPDANTTTSGPPYAPASPNAAVRSYCWNLVEAHDEAIVAALYASFDQWVDAKQDAVHHLCGQTVVAACDYSDDAKAKAEEARNAARIAHVQWEAREAVRKVDLKRADLEAAQDALNTALASAKAKADMVSPGADALETAQEKVASLKARLAEVVAHEEVLERVITDLENIATGKDAAKAKDDNEDGEETGELDVEALLTPVDPVSDALPAVETLPEEAVEKIKEEAQVMGAQMEVVAAAKKEATEAEAEAKDLDDEVSALKTRIKKMAAKMGKMENRVARKEEAAKKARREAVKLRKELEALQTELKDAEETQASRVEELDAAKSKEAEAATALSTQQEELATLRDRVTSYRMSPADAIARDLASALAAQEKAQRALDKLQGKVATANGKQAAAEKALADAKASLEQAEAHAVKAQAQAQAQQAADGEGSWW